MEFRAALQDWNEHLVIVAQERDEHGCRVRRVRPVQLMLEPCGDEVAEPTFQLNAREAQSLINALWVAGLRPSGFKDEPAHPLIAAKDAHISDLRAVAFKGLGIAP